jgi:hypothetical protein
MDDYSFFRKKKLFNCQQAQCLVMLSLQMNVMLVSLNDSKFCRKLATPVWHNKIFSF